MPTSMTTGCGGAAGYEQREYRWTFTGTSAETGKSVRLPGYEEWTIASDGLIAMSRGHYDQSEYDRQLQHGIDQTI